MYHLIRRTNTSSSVQTSNRPECFRGLLLIAVALVCFGLAPARSAFGVSPAPDGGYPSANTAEGTNALFSLTSGVWNTALGYRALYNANAGGFNTASGSSALYSNTTGNFNTANGSSALYHNTVASDNTASGYAALFNNTTGTDNTANGFKALFNNNTGSNNTANGVQALASNTTGNHNMATGFQALFKNNIGYQNTANGTETLFNNTTGFNNTASGFQALSFNTTGFDNTANGLDALFHNNTGGRNIALGYAAGYNLTTGNDNIDIGNQGVAGESDTIRIGTQGTQNDTFIAGISATTVAGGIPVVVDGTTGQLGIAATSSQRFKAEIKPMDKASEAILALKPVTFRYKQELDPKGIPQFGLVAEEVEKVNPALVTRDTKGNVYTVRYDAVNAMLLNEFLKQHRIVQEQQTEIKALAAQLKEQAALLQKVSNRLELNKPAPQMVENNQ